MRLRRTISILFALSLSPGYAVSAETCTAAFASLEKGAGTQEAGEWLRDVSGRDWQGYQIIPFNAGSFNKVYKLKDPGGKTVAILKKLGDRDLSLKSVQEKMVEFDVPGLHRSYEPGYMLKRNRAAYDVSEAIGFRNVPWAGNGTTSKGAPAYLNEFLEGYQEGEKVPLDQLHAIPREQAQKLYLLDVIFGGQDRHARNWMVGPGQKVAIIDNDFTFSMSPKHRWKTFSDPATYFPQALGAIDGDVKSKILGFSADQLGQILQKNDIPPRAAELAKLRLLGVQEALREGQPLEAILADFNQVAYLTNDRAMYFGMAIGGASAAAAGAAFAVDKLKSP